MQTPPDNCSGAPTVSNAVSGDVRGMGEAVSALLKDPERRRTLGERAKVRVCSRFNWGGLSEVAERAYRVGYGWWTRIEF